MGAGVDEDGAGELVSLALLVRNCWLKECSGDLQVLGGSADGDGGVPLQVSVIVLDPVGQGSRDDGARGCSSVIRSSEQGLGQSRGQRCNRQEGAWMHLLGDKKDL